MFVWIPDTCNCRAALAALKFNRGDASVPAVPRMLVRPSVPPLMVMLAVLLAPLTVTPFVIVLASTVPPLMFKLPVA